MFQCAILCGANKYSTNQLYNFKYQKYVYMYIHYKYLCSGANEPLVLWLMYAKPSELPHRQIFAFESHAPKKSTEHKYKKIKKKKKKNKHKKKCISKYAIRKCAIFWTHQKNHGQMFMWSLMTQCWITRLYMVNGIWYIALMQINVVSIDELVNPFG